MVSLAVWCHCIKVCPRFFAALALVSLLICGCGGGSGSSGASGYSASSSTSSPTPSPSSPPASLTTSEVRLVNNRPVLFVNDRELTPSVFTEVYYHPDDMPAHANQALYASGDSRWVTAMKKVIDRAKENGVKVVMARIWWSDVDPSTARPSPISSNFTFAKLDEVMNHAQAEGMYVILMSDLHNKYPAWWKAENSLPYATARNTGCDFCETDSYGNQYNNPSMGSDKVRSDFGGFLEALVSRYKAHPALIGWAFGLGASGEDGYGPNYILVLGLGGYPPLEGGWQPLMFTDYSPFFQRAFKEWLRAKYKTDEALQAAWSDGAASFSHFIMPGPEEMVKDAAAFGMNKFPEPDSSGGGNYAEALTPKGMDFYEFRNFTRDSETDFYAGIFKNNDRNHILILNGGATPRKSLLTHSRVDGIMGNPNLTYTDDKGGRGSQSNAIMSEIATVTGAGKLCLIASENSDGTLELREPQQLTYLETTGKSVRSGGGWMGYASDLLDSGGTESIWLPTWSSPQAMEVVKKIAAYAPSQGRAAPGSNCPGKE
ncbi:MAG: beta-galactosidase [Candidatus Eremiobacteraeota bacterium]|nr:beta-galactosidase [Candidatus Eremiobacteraeota bacterium]